MISTLEQHIREVPLRDVDLEDFTYRFHLDNAQKEKWLESDLKEKGQIYPITLIEKSNGKLALLDGFARCKAVQKLSAAGQDVPALRAHILSIGQFSDADLFKRLCLTNMRGQFSYCSFERGQFFRLFLDRGLTPFEMSQETGHTPHEIEDLMEIGTAPEALGRMLQGANLHPAYIAMLVRSARAWMDTCFLQDVTHTIQALLEKGQSEALTMKSWRFYLDFYWAGDRPFMAR